MMLQFTMPAWRDRHGQQNLPAHINKREATQAVRARDDGLGTAG